MFFQVEYFQFLEFSLVVHFMWVTIFRVHSVFLLGITHAVIYQFQLPFVNLLCFMLIPLK